MHLDYDLKDENMNRNVTFLQAMCRLKGKNSNHGDSGFHSLHGRIEHFMCASTM